MYNIDQELEIICKESGTKDFFDSLGLSDFYQNHQPKSLTKYLLPYLRHPRLKYYQLLENHNKPKLEPKKTYIKYINIDKAFIDHEIGSHIKSGGILIGCGKLINDKFIKSNYSLEWSHLMLKFDPSVIVNKKGKVVRGRLEVRTFVIKISKNYIFYRNFENDKRGFMQRQKDKIEVELKDVNNKKIS